MGQIRTLGASFIGLAHPSIETNSKLFLGTSVEKVVHLMQRKKFQKLLEAGQAKHLLLVEEAQWVTGHPK